MEKLRLVRDGDGGDGDVLAIGGKVNNVKAGELIMMPANIPHALQV